MKGAPNETRTHSGRLEERQLNINSDFLSVNSMIFSILDYSIIIGLVSRVFANGPVDRGSFLARVVTQKSQKMILDAALLNNQHYKVRIKGKLEQSRKGVAPYPTLWCSSY